MADVQPQDREPDASRHQAPAANAKFDTGNAKRRLFVIIAIIVVALVITAAVIWWLIARNYETTDDAYIDAHIVHLSPEIAGPVLQVDISDNMRVQKDQLLVEIDPADAATHFAQIKAQEAQAEAQAAQAQAQIRVSEATYQQAMASANGAAAQATNAARDWARTQDLIKMKSPAVTAQQIDQAEAASINTAAQRDAAEKQAKASQAQVDLVSGRTLRLAKLGVDHDHYGRLAAPPSATAAAMP